MEPIGGVVLTRRAASYLEPLKGGKVPIEILVRGKDPEENKKQFQTCIDTLKNAGKKVAVLKKDNSTGGFADEWKAAFAEAGIKEEDQVDLAPILSQAALSVKDEKELVCSSGFGTRALSMLTFHSAPSATLPAPPAPS
jgi:nucleosome binding factor SPN SPT16 subunit